MLNSNLRKEPNFITFISRMSVCLFMVFRSLCPPFLMVFVILLEKDDVFKLLIYLDVYFFPCVSILPAGSVEASLLRTLDL